MFDYVGLLKSVRSPDRVRSSQIIGAVVDDFETLGSPDDTLIAGVGSIEGTRVLVFAQEKPRGRDAETAARVNYGMLTAVGYWFVVEQLERALGEHLGDLRAEGRRERLRAAAGVADDGAAVFNKLVQPLPLLVGQLLAAALPHAGEQLSAVTIGLFLHGLGRQILRQVQRILINGFRSPRDAPNRAADDQHANRNRGHRRHCAHSCSFHSCKLP